MFQTTNQICHERRILPGGTVVGAEDAVVQTHGQDRQELSASRAQRAHRMAQEVWTWGILYKYIYNI